MEAAKQEQQITKNQLNAKRPASNDISLTVEDIREDAVLRAKNEGKPGPSLVSYEDDGDEEPSVQKRHENLDNENIQKNLQANVLENRKTEMMREEIQKEEDITKGDMIIEKPELPVIFIYVE